MERARAATTWAATVSPNARLQSPRVISAAVLLPPAATVNAARAIITAAPAKVPAAQPMEDATKTAAVVSLIPALAAASASPAPTVAANVRRHVARPMAHATRTDAMASTVPLGPAPVPPVTFSVAVVLRHVESRTGRATKMDVKASITQTAATGGAVTGIIEGAIATAYAQKRPIRAQAAAVKVVTVFVPRAIIGGASASRYMRTVHQLWV